ncbi:MAG: PfkB family carbohydrate kinase, partial [Bacillota bacterium]
EDNISHKLIELSEIQTVTRLRFFIRKEDNADYELAYRMDKEPDYELSYKAATKYVLRNRKFFELLKEKIQASDVLIINDTEKGFISERFVEVLSSIVKEENNERDKRKAQHIIIIADPKTNWQKFQSLPELIIKPNFNETLKELKLSFPKDGKDIGHNDELTRIAAELLKKYGEAIKHFVITLGKDGAAYIRIKGSSFEITMVPAINSEPKKTKSAAHCGDVFTAALGLALTLENTDILSAVVFANLVGYLQYNKSDREKVSIQDLLN